MHNWKIYDTKAAIQCIDKKITKIKLYTFKKQNKAFKSSNATVQKKKILFQNK